MSTLEQHRRAKGLTPGDVAKHMGVNKPTVWRWETGRSMPDSELTPKLAKLVGMDPLELVKALSAERYPREAVTA